MAHEYNQQSSIGLLPEGGASCMCFNDPFRHLTLSPQGMPNNCMIEIYTCMF